jgi:hypothetical protein
MLYACEPSPHFLFKTSRRHVMHMISFNTMENVLSSGLTFRSPLMIYNSGYGFLDPKISFSNLFSPNKTHTYTNTKHNNLCKNLKIDRIKKLFKSLSNVFSNIRIPNQKLHYSKQIHWHQLL